MVDFTINGMMLCVDDYIYQLRDKNEKTDQSMIFLFPRKNEDDWFDSKNTARLIEQSRIKYPQLIAAAADFIALCDTFANRYGKRYFAQTFGRSASVIFTKKGMSLGEFRDDSYGASEEIWG
jgi:hypothetical protein